jgi:hypothetical protein
MLPSQLLYDVQVTLECFASKIWGVANSQDLHADETICETMALSLLNIRSCVNAGGLIGCEY